ncbi:MAG TPA: hypothetical protein VFG23_04075 [Polyangia bacterium]|nr:hypothetical protein [Polyangia bacterium]
MRCWATNGGYRLAAALCLTFGAAAGCKGSASPSTSFGVNITVDAQALTAGERADATFGSLQVTGSETDVKQFSIAGAIASGQLRFRFIPKEQTGTLSFHFDALDANGDLYGSGDSPPVALAAAAVSATITLTASDGKTRGNGSSCTTDAACATGFCTDGVCCSERCNDICASCAQTGSTGLCTAYPAGTDPQMECTGTNFSGSDAGTDAATSSNADAGDGGPTINLPEAGIVETPTACGGTCNGMRACGFAGKGTPCGDPFCNSRKDLANLQCDGLGSCAIDLDTCPGGYACDVGSKACRTTCSANLQCQATSYCNGSTEKCMAQKADGVTCTTDAECTNGHCASGVCCQTACAAPNTCNDPSGTAGQCKCPGLSCSAGVSCTTFYRDSDNDGYGDGSGATGSTKVGCADTVPAGFVADDTDCDDNNVNAHPGQTAYFGTPRTNGTFDYNCDGTDEKEFNEYPGAACTFCPSPSVGCTTASSSSCSTAGTQASFACTSELSLLRLESGASLDVPAGTAALAITPPIGTLLTCCGCRDDSGFLTTVACGGSAAYSTCGTCSGTKATATTSVTKQQLCQ